MGAFEEKLGVIEVRPTTTLSTALVIKCKIYGLTKNIKT